ncbi:hypothetical protein MTO96_032811 [Rhipicephalus appendiculatus]
MLPAPHSARGPVRAALVRRVRTVMTGSEGKVKGSRRGGSRHYELSSCRARSILRERPVNFEACLALSLYPPPPPLEYGFFSFRSENPYGPAGTTLEEIPFCGTLQRWTVMSADGRPPNI